jgi:hypothetical protein
MIQQKQVMTQAEEVASQPDIDRRSPKHAPIEEELQQQVIDRPSTRGREGRGR